jgi:hypothetical protein
MTGILAGFVELSGHEGQHWRDVVTGRSTAEGRTDNHAMRARSRANRRPATVATTG